LVGEIGGDDKGVGVCIFHHNAEPFTTDEGLGVETIEEAGRGIASGASDHFRVEENALDFRFQFAHFGVFEDVGKAFVGKADEVSEAVGELPHEGAFGKCIRISGGILDGDDGFEFGRKPPDCHPVLPR
jgi:hypothetical protein